MTQHTTRWWLLFNCKSRLGSMSPECVVSSSPFASAKIQFRRYSFFWLNFIFSSTAKSAESILKLLFERSSSTMVSTRPESPEIDVEAMDSGDEIDPDMMPLPDRYGIRVSDKIPLIPNIIQIPYAEDPDNDQKKSAIEILEELVATFKNVTLDYHLDFEPRGGDLRNFQITVRAGKREATGTGGTLMEAKCEAAENCLQSLKLFGLGDINFERHLKQFKKTQREQDLLVILHRTCVQFGFTEPAYEFEMKEKEEKENEADGNGFEIEAKCFVDVGKISYVTVATDDYKQVAQRMAAQSMYYEIQRAYNYEVTRALEKPILAVNGINGSADHE